MFGEPRYRTFHGIGGTAAAVFALAGDGLTIPLLLALGTPAAAATVIGVLPFAFSAAQLLVPSLLRRTDGNLRLVTLVILAVGETRGFVLAGVVILHELHLIPSPVAIVAIAAVMSLAGAASAIGGANLMAWYGAILPDGERRFVAPRVMGITQGLGAVLLLPVALVVQAGLSAIGLLVYAIIFGIAGVFGIAELAVVRRLRRPGRVRVAPRGEAPPRSPGDEPVHPRGRDRGVRGRHGPVPLDLQHQRPATAARLRDPALRDRVGSRARLRDRRRRLAQPRLRLADPAPRSSCAAAR